MIDSHCHLNFNSIKDNIDAIVNNALLNDVTTILSINIDPNDFTDHYKLINKFKFIYISYGLHPEKVSRIKNISKESIIKNSELDKVIGIGETGLDFYHSTDFIKEQYLSFESHIEASIETNLPLIIHQRSSENEIIEVLSSYKKKNNLKVVFHCFTGTKKLLNFCLDNDYLISLSGIITFKNAFKLREVIHDLPLSSILIETDSPFLAPVPKRGKENEPANVKFVAEYLAEFFNTSLENLISETDKNFYNLFAKAVKYK